MSGISLNQTPSSQISCNLWVKQQSGLISLAIFLIAFIGLGIGFQNSLNADFIVSGTVTLLILSFLICHFCKEKKSANKRQSIVSVNSRKSASLVSSTSAPASGVLTSASPISTSPISANPDPATPTPQPGSGAQIDRTEPQSSHPLLPAQAMASEPTSSPSPEGKEDKSFTSKPVTKAPFSFCFTSTLMSNPISSWGNWDRLVVKTLINDKFQYSYAYHNRVTEEFDYTKPKDWREINNPWSREFDPQNLTIYYLNHETQEESDTPPVGWIEADLRIEAYF